jgi:hypothetical protein
MVRPNDRYFKSAPIKVYRLWRASRKQKRSASISSPLSLLRAYLTVLGGRSVLLMSSYWVSGPSDASALKTCLAEDGKQSTTSGSGGPISFGLTGELAGELMLPISGTSEHVRPADKLCLEY